MGHWGRFSEMACSQQAKSIASVISAIDWERHAVCYGKLSSKIEIQQL